MEENNGDQSKESARWSVINTQNGGKEGTNILYVILLECIKM